MPLSPADHFNNLKQKVADTFQKDHATTDVNYVNWKGQDIVDFQQDLLDKTGGRISERWFYTHFKSDNARLPRVDMLNILSAYAGYKNWADYLRSNGVTDDQVVFAQPNPEAAKKMMSYILVSAVLAIMAIAAFQLIQGPTVYTFCFVDADHKKPIENQLIEVAVLRPGESPLHYTADSAGCIALEAYGDKIQFVVSSPYYKTDTIIRSSFKRTKRENVQLRTDDYAMMIDLFSSANVDDWKKRRQQLGKMFNDEAVIYQIDAATSRPVELYTKAEFIDRLTMPLSSLKHLRVLETLHKGDRISVLRFTLTDDE